MIFFPSTQVIFLTPFFSLEGVKRITCLKIMGTSTHNIERHPFSRGTCIEAIDLLLGKDHISAFKVYHVGSKLRHLHHKY